MLNSMLHLLFSLLALVAAAPIEAETVGHGNSWQYGAGGGIIGFIVLILDIIVFSKSPIFLPRSRERQLCWGWFPVAVQDEHEC
jgi:hypothetical protein